MANEEFTPYFARPVPMVSNGEGRGTASIPIRAQAIVDREDGRDTSAPTALSRPPIAGVPRDIQETLASNRRLAAAYPQDAILPGLSETRTAPPAILRKNNGYFRTAMQYLRELEWENADNRDRKADALPHLERRGTKRPREIEHPGNASGSITQRQIGLGREIYTIATSSPVNADTTAAHSSNRQGSPKPGLYDVQQSAEREQETVQGNSTFPDGTPVSISYVGRSEEWFGRDTGSETARNSGATISSSLRGLDELDDSADSRYLGHEAQSLSDNVTTPNSNAEASSHSGHTGILDDVSSSCSGEQRRDAGGGTFGLPHELSPHTQRLSQTSRDDFPDLSDADLVEIDAVFESLSKKSLAGESAPPDLRRPGSGGAFQKEGVFERVGGMPTNWEATAVQGGGHLAHAPESSEASVDHFPILTDADLARIDESSRIARTAVEKGKQQLPSKDDSRRGPGNSSVFQVSGQLVSPMVLDANQHIPPWFQEAENICNRLAKNTYATPAAYSSRTGNDAENAFIKFGEPTFVLRHDNFGRTVLSTPVRDVMSSASGDRRLMANAAEHYEMDDIQERSDRDRRTQPYMRGLESRSREGYGR
ncbi:hypothetical protein G6M86_28220 (plasmid) [Agrobacterium tumefaciens]|uniref:Protein virD3 n=1 Tax=Agrobacterium tumefaciens TaxID=358 RepID=A0AAJ4N980_AGRTU|nr:hypothetical protein G6M86_28220 [Agrobacterium tumefaciens]